MRFMSIALVLLAAACGKQESTNNTQPNVQSKPEAKTTEIQQKAPAGQPRYLMVKVPVDAEGNEIVSAAESRVVADGANLASQDTAVNAFNSAQAVKVADELDRTSSTESWGRGYFYWNTPWYPGKVIGRGLWWGRNPYLYYNNYSYGYNYGNYYNYGGCNYHYWYNY